MIIGKDHCKECDINNKLCENCEDGYIPDKNGGCTYTNNCQISYMENVLNVYLISFL